MLQTAKTESGSTSKASTQVLRLMTRVRLTQERLGCKWLAYGLHGMARINEDGSRDSVKGRGSDVNGSSPEETQLRLEADGNAHDWLRHG
uniref:Uncharacterized protein n=1 Tax=Cucumis sativus TaxID=3659 RepID=A0A0A0L7R3_CUCSA